MMVEYTAPVFWLFFLLVGISVMVLRTREPRSFRPFRVPLYPWIPIFFCAVCIYMFQSSLAHTGKGAILGLSVLLAGVPLLLLSGFNPRNTEDHKDSIAGNNPVRRKEETP
jgi:amino acid transporter